MSVFTLKHDAERVKHQVHYHSANHWRGIPKQVIQEEKSSAKHIIHQIYFEQSKEQREEINDILKKLSFVLLTV